MTFFAFTRAGWIKGAASVSAWWSRGIRNQQPVGGVLALFFSAAMGVGAGVRIGGSDLLGEAWTRMANDFARRQQTEVRLQLDGSRVGWTRLRDGRVDIGVLSFVSDGAPLPAEFDRIPLAYHVVGVGAWSEAPLFELSLAQLAAVFGGTGVKSAGVGERTTDGLAGHVGPGVPDLTIDLLRRVVMNDAELRPSVIRQATPEALLAALRNAPGVALVVGNCADLPGLKPLAIVRAPGRRGVLPTPENIHRGEYPLRLPVWLVFRREALPALFPWLRFLLGDEVAEAFGQARLVPVPRAARNEALFVLETQIVHRQK